MSSTSLQKKTSLEAAISFRRRWKKLKSALGARLGSFALYALRGYALRLSPERAHRLGTKLGRLLLRCTPYRRRLARSNLSFAFPEKSREELQRILHGCYENLGQFLAEFLRLPSLESGNIHKTVSLEGEEHLQAALAKGRGIVLLTAHFGNWEMVGAKLVASGFPLNVLARNQTDSYTTELVNGLREQAGMRVINARSRESLQILRCLRKNELVGFLIDQNAGNDGIFVDFFGRAASSAGGAALFALRTGAAVVPVFGLRTEGHLHTALLLPEVELLRTGNLKQDVETNTARLTKLVEEQIRARPELWFWLHDRWKARPPSETGEEAKK